MKKNKDNIAKELSFGDLITGVALCFLSVPYEEGMLEVPGKEKLIVNLNQLDCFTYVESVLALSYCFIAGRISRREFRHKLKFIRYRQGKIDGYASRLHYFSDWLRDNEKKKIIEDISKTVGGKVRRKKMNYMTAHRASYPALKSESEFQKMLIVEKNLSRKAFYIVGRDKIGAIKSQIQNGDIIAFTTIQQGLDIAHVGFALRQGKNLYLLHASNKEGTVVISQKTLVAYLKSNKKYSGIMIARSKVTWRS